MQFTRNDTTYRISFSHFTEINDVPGLGLIEQRSTVCRIRTGERDTPSERTIAEAKVTQFHKDTFSKDAGRKAALKAALKNNDLSLEPGYDSYRFNYAAWRAYHTRQGGIWAGQTAATTA